MISKTSSLIVPVEDYDINSDKRLLIPFIEGNKIGFVNKQSEVIVSPSYDVVLGNIYTYADYIRVAVFFSYAYERNNAAPQSYTRKKWGILNSEGKCIIEPQYSGIEIGDNTFIVSKNFGYEHNTESLLNKQGEIIIPFGVYKTIEPFENGFARCCKINSEGNNTKDLNGIINELGEVILECSERKIPRFYGKYREKNYEQVVELIKQENLAAYKKYIRKNCTLDEMTQALDQIESEESKKLTEIENTANAISREEDLFLSFQTYLASVANNEIRNKREYGNVTVVELKDGRFGVMNNGKFVVPFGLYAWIDGFDHGLARVRTNGRTTFTGNTIALIDLQNDTIIQGQDNIKKTIQNDLAEHPESFAKWGIINEKGEVVLPVIYDEVWNFFKKNRNSTKVVKEGKSKDVFFRDLNPDLSIECKGFRNFQLENSSDSYFNINDCYDNEGNFDYDSFEDAIMDGEYVPEDW